MFGSWAARAGLVTLALVAAGVASAQTKVGIVNVQTAILNTAEIKAASSALTEKYKPRQEEGQRLQKELQDIQNKLQVSQGKGPDDVELQAAGQRKQRELQHLSDDLQAQIDADRSEILQKASGHMQEVVKKLAEAKGLDVVFDTAGAIYVKPAMDLTAEATAAYDAAYPAKK